MAYDGGIVCVWDVESNLEGVRNWFRRSNRRLTGGQTGGKVAVRPAGARRSDQRRQQARQATSAVGPVDLYRSDQRHLSGQTGRSISVRPTSVEIEGSFYFR
uniref:Uncharacterized protein n=2 Tax=Oryza sativa subsp. japonica TaxID=39947 RepID=Q10J21_ORYSJ|nr:hypothetical protein [Oryza sativa Japonica Group]ABF96817.1 hypothetical protein LOC_Os03g32260 [Oryza sativa Japonica Group]